MKLSKITKALVVVGVGAVLYLAEAVGVNVENVDTQTLEFVVGDLATAFLVWLFPNKE